MAGIDDPVLEFHELDLEAVEFAEISAAEFGGLILAVAVVAVFFLVFAELHFEFFVELVNVVFADAVELFCDEIWIHEGGR